MILLAAMAACGSRSPDVAFRAWIGGDVYLGSARAWLTPALQTTLGANGVVNLEGGVGPGTGSDPSAGAAVRLVNDPAVLPALAAAGVRWVDLANNHATDAEDGGAATRAAVQAAGLVPVGREAGAASAGGFTLAAFDLTRGESPVIAELAPPVVVLLHSAGPPSPAPTPEVVAAVEAALAQGAAVVAVHGSHAWGPIERRGDAVIAWGLGNLAFDCACTDSADGAILTLGFGAGAPEAALWPIRAGLRGELARAQPDTAVADAIAALSPGWTVQPDGRVAESVP